MSSKGLKMANSEVVRLEDVASLSSLATAFWRAAKGKRHLAAVRAFEERLSAELGALAADILNGSVAVGVSHSFRIHDPKPRTIHAPCFRERVLHHAVMAHVGPILDRSLVADSFACRPGKGALAAVQRAQRQSRRFPYFAKLDARSYFASIDHRTLLSLLRRRIRGRGILSLLQRIIASHHGEAGSGLPIGALTSQYFASLYLGTVDRFILEERKLGLVRYMDDVVIWGRTRQEVSEGAREAQALGKEALKLDLLLKQPSTSTSRGVPLCCFRVFADRLLLSERRKRRYRRARRRWESAYHLGLLGAEELQAAYSSAQAITSHARSCTWRRAELEGRPAPDV